MAISTKALIATTNKILMLSENLYTINDPINAVQLFGVKVAAELVAAATCVWALQITPLTALVLVGGICILHQLR